MRRFEQLGVIGCGLMGGSFALALKRAGLVKRVVGYSKSPSTTKLAHSMGVIDIEAKSALQACTGSDIILLAVPVSATESTLKNIRAFVHPGTLVMDVGSTKQDVVDAAKQTLGDNFVYFIPAHPIAGKESAGVKYSDVNLYKGANVILTPLPETHAVQLEQAEAVWKALGARVTSMDPKEHDMILAAVSHLPHLVAFSYINGLLAQPDAERLMSFAGPGFRDFSRIAAGDVVLWRDVLLANRREVLKQLKELGQALQQMRQALHQNDGAELERLIKQASTARMKWPENK